MATKLIKLDDDIFVEIEVPGDQIERISGGTANKVQATLDKIKPLLINACRPISAAWSEINKEMSVKNAEVELGLSFEAEGNLYITKSKANANITIKLILQPQTQGTEAKEGTQE